MEREELDQLTEKIIGCAYTVSNKLGAGFLEKVYENALAHELKGKGLSVEQQEPIKVYYDSVVVGEYICDLVAERAVLIELKASKKPEEVHAAQCMNYLKATGLKVCLLLNFGKGKVQVRRIVNNF